MISFYSSDFIKTDTQYTMSSKGKLLLIYDGHQFMKSHQFKNRIYWRCTQKASLKCHARVIQDISTNQLEASNVVHNHEVLRGRRKIGELKTLRAQYGLPPK